MPRTAASTVRMKLSGHLTGTLRRSCSCLRWQGVEMAPYYCYGTGGYTTSATTLNYSNSFYATSSDTTTGFTRWGPIIIATDYSYAETEAEAQYRRFHAGQFTERKEECAKALALLM